eukprot:GFUD01019609.1.p1 GENE.GFUD01019609.1~~GFUD01019609.1.p1  ORF type:complete len:341 (-),score=104.04 GFUD01019609.1:168-1190(-)
MAESEGGSSRSITRLSSSRSRLGLTGLLGQSQTLLSSTRQGLLGQTEELLNNPTNSSQPEDRMGSANSRPSENSRTDSVPGHSQSNSNSSQTRMDTGNSHLSEDITDSVPGHSQTRMDTADSSQTRMDTDTASSPREYRIRTDLLPDTVPGHSQSATNSLSSVSQPEPSTSTSTAQVVSNQSSSTRADIVTDLRQTLTDVKLLQEFRLFLRIKIDRNKSGDPDYKKMGEQWLDFVMICEQVFELPEGEVDAKIYLMIEIGQKFLGKPPDGYNMAMKNQLNRKELINHCRNLSEKVTCDPDDSLLRDGYEYVYSKLDQKHDVFRKTYRPTTMLAAVMCVLS